MRCSSAQKLMVAAVDRELDPRRMEALDRHAAACASCRSELATTRAVLGRVAALPAETEDSPRLEQATLRAVRLAAAAEQEERPRWWRMPALSVLAVAAVLAVVAVGLRQYIDAPLAPGSSPAAAPAPVRVAKPAEKAVAPVQSQPERDSAVVAHSRTVMPVVPAEPPAELAERPELFVDLPILRHMEKLEHLEAIEATAVDDDTTPGTNEEDRSNG